MLVREDVLIQFINKGIIIEQEALEHILSNNLNTNLILSTLQDNDILFLTKEELLKTASSIESKEIVVKGDIKEKNIAKFIEGSVDFIKNDSRRRDLKEIDHFINYFNDRYNFLKNILLRHTELKNVISLKRLSNMKNVKGVAVIGMVVDARLTKNGHTFIELEDPSGGLNVIALQNKNLGERLMLDEVIGIVGDLSDNTLFANSIIYPDFIHKKETIIKDTIKAVFISDLHFGSKEFIDKIRTRFLRWINDASGSALNVKYLCIAGDLVDGVGIYPGQEEDLAVKDIYAQYKLFEDFIEKIPEHIEIIVCPGNHDAVRQAEPQPAVGKDLLSRAYKLNNIHLTTNPSTFDIHKNNSEGLRVLMYHGYSFTRLIDSVPFLRARGTTQPQHILKEVLIKRHLAPTFGSTLIIPNSVDELVIRDVPDVLHTGDLHSFAVDKYNGVLMLSTSTFQDQTPFMDRVGHTANPGKITLLNLNDKRVTIEDFMK